MVTTTKKLLAAGFVLTIGLGLAWPFRRTEPFQQHPAVQPSPASAAAARVAAKADGERHSSLKPLLVQTASDLPAATPQASEQTFAMAATQTSIESSAEVVEPSPPPISTLAGAADAETGVSAPIEELEERIHVVHDGDSLERLAGRYLGDEGRALEIFDLNREVLANPHWLPIGAEIRIPRDARSAAE